MKRSTAVRHLVELSEASDAQKRIVSEHIRWPVTALWIAGDLLKNGREVDQNVVIIMLDVPAAELPSMALHPAAGWCTDVLRLNKRPLLTRWRPASLPAWDHVQRRVARFWTAETGVEQRTLDALAADRLSDVEVLEPSPAELRELTSRELRRSEAHLRQILDEYWDGRWRKRHTGYGTYPDDHLWRAAEAVMSMRDALDEL